MGQTNEAAAVAAYLDDMVVQMALMARAHGLMARAELLDGYNREIGGSGDADPAGDRPRA